MSHDHLKEEDVMDHLVKFCRSLASLPSPATGRVMKQDPHLGAEFTKIVSKWTQKNLEKGKITKFEKVHLVKSDESRVDFLPVDVSSETMSCLSVSESVKVVLRDGGSESTGKEFLEVWSQEKLSSNLDLAALDVHGAVYSDGEFGCLEWSPDETMIAYIAEKKALKSEPFYTQKPRTDKDATSPLSRGDEYIYKPDWGEQLVGKIDSVIVVHHLGTDTVVLPSGVPTHYSPGQLVWGADGGTLYGTVLETEPRRLGLVFCTNRPSYVFQLTLDGKFKLLTDKGLYVRSPRLSPDGKSLVWLQRPSGGPHNGSHQLIHYDISTSERRVVVDIVDREDDNGFCGLFPELTSSLPKRCFTADSTQIICNSVCKTNIGAYIINLATKKVTMLPWQRASSLSVLDVSVDGVLATTSSLCCPPSLVLTKTIDAAIWYDVTDTKTELPQAQIRISSLEADNVDDKFREFNSLYIGPQVQSQEGEKIPLIVFPHGGPHACSVNSFNLNAAFFVKMNIGVLLVNFRGSTGIGQDGVNFLPNRIGDADVKDVQQATEEILKALPHLDSDNVGLYGGSHGGYLVTHLSGQYPNFYKAVVACNPVVNVASMYTTTDIPDWPVVEGGVGELNEAKPLAPDTMAKLMTVSPMHRVDKVKTPTLLLIGSKDLRVPPCQGISYYNALKTRGIPTRLNLYEDNHSLSLVPVMMDSLINAGLWFWEYLKPRF